ncbi:hypothetical protein JAAARDRAFT_416234 [Jaapia argillacea MUCL 33604]|uniref:Uncharacterized protein n=1 Tax=Jaapia argillacea MUCL 33604 TaxID=933084 RepID=A0A067PG62_9AGAM|nr:hypothetical protein JAAARDRAFT_416234 [Jaapia argillacea MUCL 33604]
MIPSEKWHVTATSPTCLLISLDETPHALVRPFNKFPKPHPPGSSSQNIYHVHRVHSPAAYPRPTALVPGNPLPLPIPRVAYQLRTLVPRTTQQRSKTLGGKKRVIHWTVLASNSTSEKRGIWRSMMMLSLRGSITRRISSSSRNILEPTKLSSLIAPFVAVALERQIIPLRSGNPFLEFTLTKPKRLPQLVSIVTFLGMKHHPS